jgi:hypothetical protein
MELLTDLITRKIEPEHVQAKPPDRSPIADLITATSTPAPARAYEIAAFNFLLAKQAALGISELWQCRNSGIDGLLDLDDGRRVALEIKYRMNWMKACQACSQVGWYRKHVDVNEKEKVSSALVVFEAFSGDWARRPSTRLLENGWNFWYAGHHEVEGLRIDLVRFRAPSVESFPQALAAARERAGLAHAVGS